MRTKWTTHLAFASSVIWKRFRYASRKCEYSGYPIVGPRYNLLLKQTSMHLPERRSIGTGTGGKQESVLKSIRAASVILCIRLNDTEKALEASRAAIRGGIRAIEVTLTTPRAAELISTLHQEFPDINVGAGTVLTEQDVDIAADAGASFVMSPGTDVDVVRRSEEKGMLAIPGAATANEICQAYYRAKARVVKVFPIAHCGGLGFIQAMQGPLGHVPLIPTSGVPADAIGDFLSQSNVVAIGASKQIVHPEAVARCDWDDISRRAAFWASGSKSRCTDKFNKENGA